MGIFATNPHSVLTSSQQASYWAALLAHPCLSLPCQQTPAQGGGLPAPTLALHSWDRLGCTHM